MVLLYQSERRVLRWSRRATAGPCCVVQCIRSQGSLGQAHMPTHLRSPPLTSHTPPHRREVETGAPEEEPATPEAITPPRRIETPIETALAGAPVAARLTPDGLEELAPAPEEEDEALVVVEEPLLVAPQEVRPR